MLPIGITVVCFVLAASASHLDEILDLPGLPSKPVFRQYSGYLNATNGRKLHYWFVESEISPSTAPLLLWMNGGPGCSSISGLLTEHGPFRASSNKKVLTLNDYSWNKVANVLYLEAPAGVGYSYSEDKNYKTDDDAVSLDNYIALQHFFEKFPQFSKNDFYITGESYGGIYVPTLAVRVLNGTVPINLKGFAVGNALSSSPFNDNSRMFFLYYHGALGINQWNKLTTYCCSGSIQHSTCNFYNNSNEECTKEVERILISLIFSGVNPYNMYDECKPSSTRTPGLSRIQVDIQHLFQHNKHQNLLKKIPVDIDPPCINSDDAAAYLNTPNVRKALHIPSQVQEWTLCSKDVSGQYVNVYDSMTAQYEFLLQKVRGLVYNGDVDAVCNVLGDEWFVESLGKKVLLDYTNWKIGTQVGGFVKRFENLDFVTVRGAGHMVPTDKPAEALQMITNFLNGKPY